MELFVTDLDGTLLDKEHSVKKSTIKLMEKLQERGIKVATATGRILSSVRFLKEELGLNLDYYILGNGSVLTDSNFNILYKKSIDYGVIRALQDYFEKIPLGGIRNALSVENIYCLSSEPQKDKSYFFSANIDDMEDKEIVSFVANYEGRDINEIERIASDMKQKFPEVEIFQNQHFIDVAPKGSSKAAGIQAVMKKLGSVKKLYTIGDSYNDIPMLQMTKDSYTFHSSPEIVKNNAGAVVSDFEECVRDYILADKINT